MQHVDPELIRFRATESASVIEAVREGAGIGFLSRHDADGKADLVEVMPPRPEWMSPLWLVSHVDLHRTPKVQAFLTHLKAEAKSWVGIGPNVVAAS